MSPSGLELPRVYCAGPLFNAAERREMTEIADAFVEAGFDVYLPHRDGMEFRLILDALGERGWPTKVAGQFLHAAIFALDVYQLAVECGAMVWNLNGRTPDEGAVSEAAMAWTLGRPLVAYSNDVRTLVAGRINPLLVGLVEFETHAEIAALPEALLNAIDQQHQDQVPPRDLPPQMRETMERGAQLWQSMQDCGAQFDNQRIADVVSKLFAPVEHKWT